MPDMLFGPVSSVLRLQKSRAWEIPEAEQSYTEAHRKDFRDHRNATVEGQDLASTYVLHPHPRTGCPDFGMGWKGVMGQSVTEQGMTVWRCDGVESGVLNQMSAEARLIKRKMRIGKWAKLKFRLGSKLWNWKTFYTKGDRYLWSSK